MECCEMIGKSAAVLAFAVAMNSGVVSAQEEDLRFNEDVAKKVAGCAVTALSTGLRNLPLGVEAPPKSVFHVLREVSSRTLGNELALLTMLKKSRVYDDANKTGTPKGTELTRNDIGACQIWFGYAARRIEWEKTAPLPEQKSGIPTCSPVREISI
jgi:hypothetical protein